MPSRLTSGNAGTTSPTIIKSQSINPIQSMIQIPNDMADNLIRHVPILLAKIERSDNKISNAYRIVYKQIQKLEKIKSKIRNNTQSEKP